MPRREVFQYTPCAHRTIPLTIGGKHIARLSSSCYNETEWEIPDNIKEMIVLPPIVDNERDMPRTRNQIIRQMLQPIGWTIEEEEWLYEYLNRYTAFIILSIQSEWNSLLRLAAFDLGAHFKKHFSLGRIKCRPVDLSNEHGYHLDNPFTSILVYDGDVPLCFDPLPRDYLFRMLVNWEPAEESYLFKMLDCSLSASRECQRHDESIEEKEFRTTGFQYYDIAYNVFKTHNAAQIDFSDVPGYHINNPVVIDSESSSEDVSVGSNSVV
ncbi:hypothetical protein DH2020_042877 [Rehmannia glutinosa]|uniref:Uncharacterized protein n=1 Tax=Rehmannia glutinosa TaxID=99300 RepID=A0ABR0UM61_REHGL